MLWRRYRQRRGSFNLAMRIDTAASRMLCVELGSRSRNATFEIADFSPYHDRAPEVEATIEDALGMLNAIAKKAPAE